jgi:hypothetical protein
VTIVTAPVVETITPLPETTTTVVLATTVIVTTTTAIADTTPNDVIDTTTTGFVEDETTTTIFILPDDLGTSISTCTSSEFDCKAAGCTNPDNEKCTGTCIPKSWVNDGKEECADGSDEGTIGMKNKTKKHLVLDRSKGFLSDNLKCF